MKLRYKSFLLAIYLFCLSTSCFGNTNPVHDSLAAKDLKPYGRYTLNDQYLELISSAVHFGFSFEGKECKVFASIGNVNGHNYLQYELDGVYQKKIRINGNDNQPVIITAPQKGKHTVWIYKTTEAHTGAILIQKIIGANVRSVQEQAHPSIEFIGNSITCGAAADPSDVPCGTGEYHDQHTRTLLTARALPVHWASALC